jgi:hypothetical protein
MIDEIDYIISDDTSKESVTLTKKDLYKQCNINYDTNLLDLNNDIITKVFYDNAEIIQECTIAENQLKIQIETNLAKKKMEESEKNKMTHKYFSIKEKSIYI